MSNRYADGRSHCRAERRRDERVLLVAVSAVLAIWIFACVGCGRGNEEFDMSRRTIRGCVTTTRGEGVPGVTLFARPVRRTRPDDVISAECDGDGRFELVAGEAESYRIVAVPSYASRQNGPRQPYSVTGGLQAAALEGVRPGAVGVSIVLEDGVALVVQIRRRVAGRARSGAVRCIGKDAGSEVGVSGYWKSPGRESVRLWNLAPKEYEVTVVEYVGVGGIEEKSETVLHQVRVAAGGSPVEVTLEE